MSKILKGLIAPQLTPFNSDGSINYNEYTRLTSYLTGNGVNGIFVCGTTGEFVNLTIQERINLLRAAQDGIRNDATILFNVTALNLEDVQILCDAAKNFDADAVSFTPPYYHSYDQIALASYFEKSIACAGDIPVYLYNMPGMTKNPITPALLSRLCKTCPTIRGIKDSSMDYMTFLEFQNCKPDSDFRIITGNDAQVLTTLMAGADSAVIAMAGVFPCLCKSIFTLFEEGKLNEAKAAQDTVMELRGLVRSAMPIMSHKYILEKLGFCMGPARYPFRNLNVSEKEKIDSTLASLNLLP